MSKLSSVAMGHFFIIMAVSRQKKEEIIKDLEDKFKRHKSAVFVNYSGINVGSLEKIRGELRKEGIDMKVAKRTLLEFVFKKLNILVDISALSGQIAVIFGYKDEVTPAKIIHKFAKELETLKVLGGILDNKFVEESYITALAELPPYQDLLSKMVGSMQAPIAGLANVLQGNIRGLVQVLNAISQK